MLLQAKEGKDCSKPPEAEREAGDRCSLRASEGASPANTWILDSRPVRQIRFCCLSHSMALGYISCGNQTSYYDLFWCPNYPFLGQRTSGDFCILSTWPHPSLCTSLLSGITRCLRLTLNFCCPGFPWWLRWWRICLQCRRPKFDSWVGKSPWRREWLTHSDILAWRIPWTDGVTNSQTWLSN